MICFRLCFGTTNVKNISVKINMNFELVMLHITQNVITENQLEKNNQTSEIGIFAFS